MTQSDGNIYLPWDYRVTGYYVDRMGREQWFREEVVHKGEIETLPKIVAEKLKKPRERFFSKDIEKHGRVIYGSEFKIFVASKIKVFRNRAEKDNAVHCSTVMPDDTK